MSTLINQTELGLINLEAMTGIFPFLQSLIRISEKKLSIILTGKHVSNLNLRTIKYISHPAVKEIYIFSKHKITSKIPQIKPTSNSKRGHGHEP